MRVERPPTADAVQRAVQAAGRSGLRIKPIGAGHSFTGIAVAPGVQLDLTDLSGVIDADVATGPGTLAAAPVCTSSPRCSPRTASPCRTWATSTARRSPARPRPAPTAPASGSAASPPRSSGALVTGRRRATHGQRDRASPTCYPAARVGLGALGVIVEVTLQLVPAFVLHAVEKPKPIDEVLDNWHDARSRDRPLRVLLVPAHRVRPHQDEHATAGGRDAITAEPLHGGSTMSCSPTASTGRWSQPAASTRDDLIARQADRSGHGHRVTATSRDLSPAVFTTTAAVRFREMEYAVAARRPCPTRSARCAHSSSGRAGG